MSESLDKMVCIDMNVLNKVFLIIGDSSDRKIDNNGKEYLISGKELSSIVQTFKRIIDFKNRGISSDVSYFDSTEYKKIYDKYLNAIYDPIVDKKVNNKTPKIDEEKILKIGIELYDEIEGIKSLSSLIEQIRKEIMEVQSNDLSENINTILINFKKLLNDGGTVEQYSNLKTELDLIIKKTYVSSINNYPLDNKKIYLVKENNEVKILSSYNINDFSYGYIYSPNSIVSVTSKNDNSFISFYNLKSDDYKIVINEDRPIGFYAVTYGEGYINPNYKKAKTILDQYGLEFVEIDKTKFLEASDIDKKGLIDNLLEDRGTPEKDANEDFYKKFDSFYTNFMALKGGKYDESNIITLFENSYNIIRSQSWLNLDYLLSQDPALIRQVLENNIYYSYNIFLNEKITMNSLEEFDKTFYDRRKDIKLNAAYTGISEILEEIHKGSRARKEEILNIINASPCRESYLLLTFIKKINSRRKTTEEVNINSTPIYFESETGRAR